MIFYITVLRSLAAVIITNSHYTGVYPTDLIANGGLCGDVIFFAVSGFCLTNIKQKFPKWYLKRIIRIYPIIWIITITYILLGFYTFDGWTIEEYFLYPTYYHFVASIIILYIPYFIIITNKTFSNNIPKVMITLFIVQIVVYVLFYDKSMYHIDVVREPMIRFLFFQSMLLGAYFRKNDEKYRNKNRAINWMILSTIFVIYFGSKLSFSKLEMLSYYQIINQLILFLFLYYALKCFAGIDDKLEILPIKIKNIMGYIAKITLEIYVVQYVIIPRLSYIAFPLNWLVITAIIILSASVLHMVSKKIISVIETKVNITSRLKLKGGEN